MAAGEILNFIVSTEDGDIQGTATYSFGNDTYSCNSLSGVIAIDFTSTLSQEIELLTGWGIWSTYIDPSNANMESVLSEVVNNLEIVKDENGAVYWPMFGLNSIGELVDGEGYQAKMLSDDILTIEGNLVPSNLSLNLTTGWNIMGYLHTSCYNAENMMAAMDTLFF